MCWMFLIIHRANDHLRYLTKQYKSALKVYDDTIKNENENIILKLNLYPLLNY